MIELYNSDCLHQLKLIKHDSVDLIITSPPYADQRKSTYGGIAPDKYVEWFLPIADELYKVLKPTGSFILNIKEKVVDGERHTYVMELILAMRKHGWKYTEEYIWHKKNSFPGKWPNRFRDAWERCIHFTKQSKIIMYQDAVKVPIGDWATSRLKHIGENEKTRMESITKSGFGKKLDNWIGKDMVYPTNVLQLATECSNKNHSAAFPESLPEWFIKLFTVEDNVVLDPFSGSGTTLSVAKRMNRNAVGIEINKEYCDMIAKDLYLGQKEKYYSSEIEREWL